MSISKDIYKQYFDSKEVPSDFVEEYKTILRLKEEYLKGKIDRKELSKEIINRIDYLLPIIKMTSINLRNIKEAVSYVDKISDSSKLYSLLIKLSNDEKTKYAVTKINLLQHDDTAKVIICGDSNIIDMISKEKNYNHYSVRSLIYDLISKDHSIIIEQQTLYDVMPIVDSDINRLKFDLRDYPGVAYGYIFDDNLGKSMVKVYEYVKTHGGDMDNISVDTMVSRINEPEKQKVKKLTQIKGKK